MLAILTVTIVITGSVFCFAPTAEYKEPIPAADTAAAGSDEIIQVKKIDSKTNETVMGIHSDVKVIPEMNKTVHMLIIGQLLLSGALVISLYGKMKAKKTQSE